MKNEFELGTQPFKPLEQLMSVFPAGSRSHVPEGGGGGNFGGGGFGRGWGGGGGAGDATVMLRLLNSRGTLCSKMGTSPLEGEMGVVEGEEEVVEVNTREVEEEGVAGIKVMEVNMTDLEEVMEEVGMVFPA